MSVSEPGKIITPWAESGLKNPIPPAANPVTGRAGFDQGFSAINMTAKEAGGIPPFGQDFNGIFYEVTNILRYMQAGGQPTFSSALAAAIGGYPKGAMVLGSDGVTLWQSKVDSNFTDPDTDPVSWGTFDIGLKADLAAPGGAGLIGVGTKTPDAPMLNLKQWLDDEVVNLRTRFGVRSEATARHNTDNIQAAYDEIGAAGGGRMRLPASPSPYYFAPSVLSETFDNWGEIIQASWGCVVARPGVLLEGDGIGRSIFQVELGDVGTYGIIAASPNGGGLRHMSARGNSATGGNSHGIISVNISTDPIHQICKNWLLEHLEISDFGSYGIGVENGDITNLRASHIYIHNVGVDGIDAKQRGPSKKNIGMNFSNILVDGFGRRLTGSAGLDFHGVGQVTNLTVRGFGLTGNTGFRMRTQNPVDEGETARMARATNLLIENTPSNDSHIGAFIGSQDCTIQGAVARGVTKGFELGGNAAGQPDRSVVSNAHAIDCAQYGYYIASRASDVTLDTAYAINCGTGFRNNGLRTNYIRAVPINCTTKFSTAALSAPTERMIASDTVGLSEFASGAAAVTVTPRGDAADLELRIQPKGALRVALMDGSGNRKVQVDGDGVGFNGAAPTGKMTLNAAATDLPTTTALVNQIRAGLINNGLGQ